MPPSRLLTVYERPGCHLCEDMVSALSEWQSELGFEIERVDVDASPELTARYGARVPVLVRGSVRSLPLLPRSRRATPHAGDGMTRWSPLPPDPESVEPSEDGRGSLREAARYPRIYAVIRQIPRGRVATYGQVAAIRGTLLGTHGSATLWPRFHPRIGQCRGSGVLNRTGALSERGGGGGNLPSTAGPRSRGRAVRRGGTGRLRCGSAGTARTSTGSSDTGSIPRLGPARPRRGGDPTTPGLRPRPCLGGAAHGGPEPISRPRGAHPG